MVSSNLHTSGGQKHTSWSYEVTGGFKIIHSKVYQIVPGGPRNWELSSTASFYFPSYPFPSYSLLPYYPHLPPFSLPLKHSSRDLITNCNWRNKPSFSLLLYFLYSVYLPQRIPLDFPSVFSLTTLQFFTVCHRTKKWLTIRINILNSYEIKAIYWK